MGLGAQLAVVAQRVLRASSSTSGYRVIRFDNRDVGLSSKLHGQRVGGVADPQTGRVRSSACRSQAVYTLEDMADDAAALLDHLGIDRAHVVGASMGGMIAQIFAAQHPQRTGGLGIIFSSNNSAAAAAAGAQGAAVVDQGAAAGLPARGDRRELGAGLARSSAAPGYPKSEEQLRADAIETYERCLLPAGHRPALRARSWAAAAWALRQADHRADRGDPRPRRQTDAARRRSGDRPAIPGARLVLFDGMAHDLPEPLWDDIVGELTTTFAEARLTAFQAPGPVEYGHITPAGTAAGRPVDRARLGKQDK